MLSYFNVELIRSVNASSTFLKHCSSSYNPPNQFRTETNPIRYRDSIITRSVICLIALFTLCQIPASILNYIYLYYRNHPLLYICYDISNFLIFLNSAVSVSRRSTEKDICEVFVQVNFFIFTCFNRKFQRELSRIFCYSMSRRHCFLQGSAHPSTKRTSTHLRLGPAPPLDVIASGFVV